MSQSYQDIDLDLEIGLVDPKIHELSICYTPITIYLLCHR